METSSWLIAGGRDRSTGAPLNVPIMPASNFNLDSTVPDGRSYSRAEGTDSTLALEALLGPLDSGEALVFGSGMAAAAVVLHRVPFGGTIAIPLDPYHGVKHIAIEGETLNRWKVLRLDLADTAGWLAALETADLVWLESPANPLMTVADLPTICGAERKRDTIVAVDSTFATPLLQQPLNLGADVVMHSATKFIGGHSDLLAGSLTTNRDDLYEEFRARRTITGGSIGALESFLTLRGARTMALRLETAQRSAQTLAERLQAHPDVATVRYPGLESHPTHQVAKTFMTGFGAMMSFDPVGAGERAGALCDHLKIVFHATSLGGVESTMERRSVIAGQEKIPPSLIRFSVGCEDTEDIWNDINNALEATA
jgi:cystathionine gamma-synthase